MKKSLVGISLSLFFHHLGRLIGKHPIIFLNISLLFTIPHLLGWIRFNHLDDFEELFMTKTGRSAKDMDLIEKIFPLNNSETIDAGRFTRTTGSVVMIIVAKDGGSMFRKELSEEIFSVYDDIYKTNVEWKGKNWNFSTICSPWIFGDCMQNSALEILRRLEEFKSGRFNPSYPVDWESYKKGMTITAMNFGGVEIDQEQRITSAKAIRFFFQLEFRDEENLQISRLWEEKFVNEMVSRRYKHVQVAIFSNLSISKGITSNLLQGISFGAMSVVSIIGFAIVTSLTCDPIRTKPWLGLAGGISAILGIISSFGFLFMIGVPYIDVVITAPTFIFGIGVDDSFVLISAWRRTSPKLSVPERMAEAYAEAAMSVTITSFTNFVSFLVGLAIPYRQTEIYVVFCATAILFCYLYQIIFFGACMALSGYREEKNLHPLTFRKLTPKDERNLTKKPNNANDHNINEAEPYSTLAMLFFRDKFSNILINRYCRLIIIFVFVLHFIAAGIGISRNIDGPDYRHGLRYNSNSWNYFTWKYKYFGDHRVQVIIKEVLDYSDPFVQAKVENLTERFETASFSSSPKLTEHWLRSYKAFLNDPRMWLFLSGFNTNNSQDFYYVLQNIFFRIPIFKKFSSDVVFNSNSSAITHSRFLIQTKDIYDAVAEIRMFKDIYHVADSCDYKTVPYSSLFRLLEQSTFVRSIAIQTVVSTIVFVNVVFLLLVPNLRCALAVAISICSIVAGIIGYMSFWGVNLDALSLVCLIMCVGYSVDFSSHVCYSYTSCKNSNTEERIRYAMYSSGMPVLQGGASTVLGVFFLSFASSEAFVILFKTNFLCIALACFHSLFLLPVLLSLLSSFSRKTSDNHQRS